MDFLIKTTRIIGLWMQFPTIFHFYDPGGHIHIIEAVKLLQADNLIGPDMDSTKSLNGH